MTFDGDGQTGGGGTCWVAVDYWGVIDVSYTAAKIPRNGYINFFSTENLPLPACSVDRIYWTGDYLRD